MYNRVSGFNFIEEDSVFLFGLRQTGKSTLLRSHFHGALYVNLLKSDIYERCHCDLELTRNDVGFANYLQKLTCILPAKLLNILCLKFDWL